MTKVTLKTMAAIAAVAALMLPITSRVAMAKEITDEMLDVYTVSGTFDDIADKVEERYDGLLDRVAFYIPYRAGTDDAEWAKLAKRFNG